MQQVQADQALAQQLMTEGVDGTATVKALRATGKQINYMPEMELDLTVDVGGFTSEVTHRQVVSPALLPQLQIGATVPVKADRSDHSKLIVVG